MSNQGDSIRIKNKQQVVDFVIPRGKKIGKFVEEAIVEKIQRELLREEKLKQYDSTG